MSDRDRATRDLVITVAAVLMVVMAIAVTLTYSPTNKTTFKVHRVHGYECIEYRHGFLGGVSCERIVAGATR